MPETNQKVSQVDICRKAFEAGETVPLAPTVGHMPAVFQELQGSQHDRGEGERVRENVKFTAEG